MVVRKLTDGARVRLSAELTGEVDELVDEIKARCPSLAALSRDGVVRSLVHLALRSPGIRRELGVRDGQ